MNCTATNTFPSNPDITGIGSRVCVYVSMALGPLTWLIAEDKNRLTDAAQTSLLTTGGMILAGIISLHTPGMGLSLIDAEVISILAFIATAGYLFLIILHTGFWNGYVRYTIFAHVLVTTAFGLAVASQADGFGGDACLPDCMPNSDFVLTIFGTRLSATSMSVRAWFFLIFGWFAVVSYGAVGITMVVSVIVPIAVFLLRQLFPSLAGRYFFLRAFGVQLGFRMPGTAAQIARYERPTPPPGIQMGISVREWRELRMQEMNATTSALHFHWIWVVVMLLLVGCLIATVEQTIADNNLGPLAGVNNVTFGQAMPILLLVQQIFRAIDGPVSEGWKRLQQHLHLARLEHYRRIQSTTNELDVSDPDGADELENESAWSHQGKLRTRAL